jgi:peptidoglycan/LPS O-acetylase OafA/YrhL
VLRFFAFLLVFIHHATDPNEITRGLPRSIASVIKTIAGAGNYGLSIFFTLSSFLIFELLLRERESAGVVRVKQFYIRRILRIWPLYYLALSLGLVFVFLNGDGVSVIVKIGWYAIFMGAWESALHGFIPNPVFPLWSISVEEQFYLFAPWIAKYFSRKSLYGVSVALILLASAWQYHLGLMSAPYNRIWADSLVQFGCFGGGLLLCLLFSGRTPRIPTWARLALSVTSVSCFMAASYLQSYYVFYLPNHPSSLLLVVLYGLASLGSILLLVALLGVDAKLLPEWAIYLGRISFGLYVFHMFALNLTRRLPITDLLAKSTPKIPLRDLLDCVFTLGLPLGLTILMATLSFRYFETPFLRMKKRYAVIESEPVGTVNKAPLS